MVDYSIKAGYVSGGSDSAHTVGTLIKGKFSLIKWLKKSLTYLGVPNQDPCCISSVNYPPDPLNLPVRLNITAGKLQYLSVAGVWTNVVASQIS